MLTRTTLVAAALAAVLWLALAAAAAGAPPRTDASIDAARHAYYVGRYRDALALYERLARERGDAEAAEHAGFMLMQGPAWYGSQVRRDLPRATELLLQAARAGRPAAQFMLNMVEQTD